MAGKTSKKSKSSGIKNAHKMSAQTTEVTEGPPTTTRVLLEMHETLLELCTDIKELLKMLTDGEVTGSPGIDSPRLSGPGNNTSSRFRSVKRKRNTVGDRTWQARSPSEILGQAEKGVLDSHPPNLDDPSGISRVLKDHRGSLSSDRRKRHKAPRTVIDLTGIDDVDDVDELESE